MRASRISLLCAFILSCMGCPVSPMFSQDSASFFASVTALLVSRIRSLRNRKDISSAAFRAPLVGTGGRTRRSLGMMRFLMHLVRNVRWFL